VKTVKNVAPPSGFRRLLFRMPIFAYRSGMGWLFGDRLMLLDHTGRVSGKRRQTVLEVVSHDPAHDSFVVASGWGPTAAWYRNVIRTPDVTIQVGRRRIPATAVPLPEDAGAEIFTEYAARHRITAKHLLPRLMGYAVDGSDADFREVGQRIPFVRFVPRPPRGAATEMGASVATGPDAVITADRLTRRFGKRRGITDVSFAVTRGEVFGFLGPNGAGKSTTIRLLLGLYRPSRGHACLFGLDPRRDGIEVRRQIGYLPGELALFPRLTGRAILDRAAHIRGLHDHRYREELVERFAAELDRPVRTLSKGNVQKIGLILAFAHRPELLVLDEPTSGLDPLLQDEFTRLVRETAADGRTVFLSSHDLDEVQRLVDRLAIIKEGRIIVTDTVEQLRASSPTTVELRFAGPVDPTPFRQMDAVRVLSHDTERVRLSVTGPMGPLLRVAADLDVVDMTSRPADLDELFLTYYRSGTDGTDRHVR
jgi:beta-exotoxin I transport system ATP-binding protein